MIYKQLKFIYCYGNNTCTGTAVCVCLVQILKIVVIRMRVQTSASVCKAPHFTCKIFVHNFI